MVPRTVAALHVVPIPALSCARFAQEEYDKFSASDLLHHRNPRHRQQMLCRDKSMNQKCRDRRAVSTNLSERRKSSERPVCEKHQAAHRHLQIADNNGASHGAPAESFLPAQWQRGLFRAHAIPVGILGRLRWVPHSCMFGCSATTEYSRGYLWCQPVGRARAAWAGPPRPVRG